MDYPFRNLVFEGGGVKGLAYVGALGVLSEKGILQKVNRVGGTSAGAITAILVGLNYSPEEIRDIIWNLDFTAFLDDSWGIIRDSARLVEDYGWYKGDYFRGWIGGLIKQKTGNADSTFNDVCRLREQRGFRDMSFIGTNLSTHFSEVFSYEHTPRWCVADAVRISMSIPLFFAAKRSIRGDVYVDGGVLENYPIKLFDRKKYLDPGSPHGVIPEYYQRDNEELERLGEAISPYVYNKETLGFRLDTKKEIAVFCDHAEPDHIQVNNFFDYAWNLISTLVDSQDSQHLHSDDWQRTIYIDTLGVGTTQFDLDDATKSALIDSGRRYTNEYFAWYDDPKNQAANRV